MTWTRFDDPNRQDAWLCDECQHEDRIWQRMKQPDGRSGKDFPKKRAVKRR
jgi:hypothetical protein